MTGFSSFHPAVSAVYFLSVLLITMFSANPFLLVFALIGGMAFFAKTEKNIAFFKDFGIYAVLFILVALSNPLFSHNGVTVLFFFNNNPVTLEALLYGINLAVMLTAVIFWFKCFNLIMTEEKLLYLFGGISPKLALVISSALRFIPLLKRQSAKINQAQKAMGLFSTDTWASKLKSMVRVYSALITWALENAIDTGSSMSARGYGLKGRTRYSLFKFRKSDLAAILLISILDGVVIAAIALGELSFSFYPSVSDPSLGAYDLSAVFAFAILCLLPFILEVKESVQWKYYSRKMSNP